MAGLSEWGITSDGLPNHPYNPYKITQNALINTFIHKATKMSHSFYATSLNFCHFATKPRHILYLTFGIIYDNI